MQENLLSAALGVVIGLVILGGIFFASDDGGSQTQTPSLPQSVRVGETPSRFIERWHDDEKNVTCWQISESISCLRD